ncbi:MAG: type II toxin-antitoxin system RelE/ParE family toxin [Gammaproteobacteria bacterium]|nr:type II toxin-antitoxin system RelE/ParE family toxin [Gammaproteobacteria bacterium]
MPYTIYRHPDILNDLFHIADLISEYSGVLVAERKISEIEETIRKLSETPNIGSLRDGIYPGLRAIPTAKKGVIAFLVDNDKKSVFIISVSYAGADWLKLVSNRA